MGVSETVKRTSDEERAARRLCFKDCSAGIHIDPENGVVGCCQSPDQCQGWVPYLDQVQSSKAKRATEDQGPVLKTFKGGGRPQNIAAEDLAARIKELIYENSDRMLLTTALGVLAIVQKELIDEHS